MCGFLCSHQRLIVLNVTIQTPGWIMEESAYSNYEDPRYDVKELFPKYGLLEGDKQRMLEFIEARNEAKEAHNAFIEHPGIREILQKKTLSQIDKMWIQVLPIMNQYLKNIEHVISLWKARYQFETKLSIYVRNRSKLETLLESIDNIGGMFLANDASVQESIKESLLAKLKEAMDLGIKTGKNINALVS